MRRVLVTGAAGYIGSVLSRLLLDSGCQVRGLDSLLFGGESLLGVYNHPRFEFLRGDVRNGQDVRHAIQDVDAVIHLAAIVGDPACAKHPQLAQETNLEASKLLLSLCNESKTIRHFVFASTCSNYGKMQGDQYAVEETPLRPVSLYAELKVKFETYLLESKTRNNFFPTALRFATVYGISPRMRFDLTVNEFIREVALGRQLLIFGEQFWRPYCHVNDLARSCMQVLEADPGKVKHNVFNVGDTRENYQKKMIAEEILKLVPESNIRYVQRTEDPRDYRVDFSKITNVLGFQITKTVPDGLKEILSILRAGLLRDPDSEHYRNA